MRRTLMVRTPRHAGAACEPFAIEITVQTATGETHSAIDDFGHDLLDELVTNLRASTEVTLGVLAARQETRRASTR